MSPMWIVLAPALLAALIGLALLRAPRAPGRLRRLRRALAGLILLTFALALATLALGLRHYLLLDADVPVATLTLHRIGPQHFDLAIETAAGDTRRFEILGDQWQLDARVLRWQTPALLAGAPPLYRLERLAGRYADIDAERHAARSVYALDDSPLPDLFDLKRRYPRWLPFVDARYGSAAYLPMLDGGRFEVLFNPRGGLVARPADARTRQLLDEAGW